MDIPERKIRNDTLPADQLMLLDGAPVFDPDDLDAAIVGVHKLLNGKHVAVYCYDKIIEQYMAANGQTPDDEAAYFETQEFVDYNTVRAVAYMGDRSPIIVETLEEEEGIEDPDEDKTFLTIAGKRWSVVECHHDITNL